MKRARLKLYIKCDPLSYPDSLVLQIYAFESLPDVSTWKIHKHLKYNMSVYELNIFSFFTPKYIPSCILSLSLTGTTIRPATPAKILSLSHSLVTCAQSVVTSCQSTWQRSLSSILSLQVSHHYHLSEFYLHHFSYIVIRLLVINTACCPSIQHISLICYTEPPVVPTHTLCCFLPLCSCSFPLPLPYILFLPSLLDYFCFKTQLKCHLLLEEFPDSPTIPSPVPTANLDQGPSPLPAHNAF